MLQIRRHPLAAEQLFGWLRVLVDLRDRAGDLRTQCVARLLGVLTQQPSQRLQHGARASQRERLADRRPRSCCCRRLVHGHAAAAAAAADSSPAGSRSS